MQTYQIRRMDTKDADDIYRIHASIVRQPMNPDFLSHIRTHARNCDSLSFVAELDGRVIGYMISHLLTFSLGIEKSAWVAAFGVTPNCMGQGVGAQLLHEVTATYKRMGVDRIYTAVPWDASDLLSFFKSLGFESSDFVNLKKD